MCYKKSWEDGPFNFSLFKSDKVDVNQCNILIEQEDEVVSNFCR